VQQLRRGGVQKRSVARVVRHQRGGGGDGALAACHVACAAARQRQSMQACTSQQAAAQPRCCVAQAAGGSARKHSLLRFAQRPHRWSAPPPAERAFRSRTRAPPAPPQPHAQPQRPSSALVVARRACARMSAAAPAQRGARVVAEHPALRALCCAGAGGRAACASGLSARLPNDTGARRSSNSRRPPSAVHRRRAYPPLRARRGRMTNAALSLVRCAECFAAALCADAVSAPPPVRSTAASCGRAASCRARA
jgi:hypothetical protein